MRWFAIAVLMVQLICMTACNTQVDTSKVTYQMDVEFVQEMFPKFKDVKSTKYSYIAEQERGIDSIGLVPTYFEGVVFVDEEYCNKLYESYRWEKCNQKIPAELFEQECDLLYNYNFSHKFNNGYVGEMYFCREFNMIYFDIED